MEDRVKLQDMLPGDVGRSGVVSYEKRRGGERERSMKEIGIDIRRVWGSRRGIT
jgi:hypothetical protein